MTLLVYAYGCCCTPGPCSSVPCPGIFHFLSSSTPISEQLVCLTIRAPEQAWIGGLDSVSTSKHRLALQARSWTLITRSNLLDCKASGQGHFLQSKPHATQVFVQGCSSITSSIISFLKQILKLFLRLWSKIWLTLL